MLVWVSLVWVGSDRVGSGHNWLCLVRLGQVGLC
jgi:hypothetical protein